MKHFLTFFRQVSLCIFLTFSFLHLTHILPAQKLLTYDSSYQADEGAEGFANFTYTLDKDKKIIKNGVFTFEREIEDSTCATSVVSDLWKGQYKNNLKEGKWEYKVFNHEVDIQNITTANVRYSVRSNIKTLRANYKDGFFDDELSYESTLYLDQRRVQQLEYFKTTFSNTKVDGAFIFRLSDNEGDICEITGRAYEGLMEGVWEFHYFEDSMKEERVYQKGVLLSLAKISNLDTLVKITYPLSGNIKKVLAEEETDFELVNKPLSLTFSDGYPRNSTYIKEQLKGEEYLNIFLENAFQYDPEVIPVHGLPIGTNRGYYRFNADEREYFEQWPEVEYEYRQRIQKIKELETGNLLFKKDSTVRVINEWAARQDSIKKIIQPWNNILLKDQIEFYNREGALIAYAKDLLEGDTISVNDEEYIFEYRTEDDTNFLSYIVQNFEARTQVADSLIHLFTTQLVELNIAHEVVALSETIKEKKTNIDSLYADEVDSEPIQALLDRAYSNYFDNEFEDKYEEFLIGSGSTPQLEQGEIILSQLTLLEEIYEEGKKISERNKMIDSAYTEYTFDPFTFSDKVPRRVKKRLYDIVTNEVIPELIETSAQEDQTPADVLNNIQQIQEVQERMVFLLDKDTQKLERRLRRNKSLEDRLELLKAS